MELIKVIFYFIFIEIKSEQVNSKTNLRNQRITGKAQSKTHNSKTIRDEKVNESPTANLKSFEFGESGTNMAGSISYIYL